METRQFNDSLDDDNAPVITTGGWSSVRSTETTGGESDEEDGYTDTETDVTGSNDGGDEDEDEGDEDEDEDTGAQPPAEFAETLTKYFNISVDDLKYGIEFVKTLAAEKQKTAANSAVQEANAIIQKRWNVTPEVFQERMVEVKKEWEALPEDMQESLNNVEGAFLLWDRVEAKRGTTAKAPVVARRTKSGKVAAEPKFLFTQSQIDNMSKDEYVKNADAILLAYSQDKVDKTK